MNNIQVFNNPEFGDIRTVEIDGKPYFVGTDVAKALGYKDTVNALKQHCRGGGKTPPHRFSWQKSGSKFHTRGRFVPPDYEVKTSVSGEIRVMGYG